MRCYGRLTMTKAPQLSKDEILLARAVAIEAAEETKRARWRQLQAIQDSLSAGELERITVDARLRAMRKVEKREVEFGRDASSSYSVYKTQAIDEILEDRYLPADNAS